jgi:transposase
MSNPRYPEEFKIEAVKQVTERGLPVADVAARLGMSTHSLYAWVKRYSKAQEQRAQEDDQHAELRRLRAELNPEDRLNADLKHVIGRKVPIRTKANLRAAAEDHMAVIASEP